MGRRSRPDAGWGNSGYAAAAAAGGGGERGVGLGPTQARRRTKPEPREKLAQHSHGGREQHLEKKVIIIT